MVKKILSASLIIFIVTAVLTACGAGNASNQATANPVGAAQSQSAVSTQTSTQTTANAQTASTQSTTGTQSSSTEKTFTKDELAKYDGQNGNKAYVAVDGVVYDVTDIPQWRGGTHQDISAGKDITDDFKNLSPHGNDILKNVPVVGKYVK